MLDEKLTAYLNEKIPEKPPLLKEMEEYAKREYIPIMEPYSMEVLLQLLTLHKPKRILEIGTAIGYSAIRMAMATDATIVTIEKDPERIEKARKFILRSGLSNRIILIEGDAIDLVDKMNDYTPFDCLFIDAAKVQYKKFFTHYEKHVTNRGLIITDNVLFKGYVYGSGSPNRKLEQIGKKIDEYNRWLLSHPKYRTVILPIGDGMSVSIGK